jgi:hypothetical protein
VAADAIARHSEPLPAGSASPEAVCLSNADAAERILRPAYWLSFAFAVRKQSFEEGRRWLRSVLVEPARELAAREYRLALELLT